MTTLPPSDVEVTTGTTPDGNQTQVDVKISRDKLSRTYTGSGSSSSEAVKKVVEAIISDPRTLEFYP